MSGIELRPTFERLSTLSPEHIREKLSEKYNSEESPVDGYIAHGRVYLSIPKEDQHLWSPRLTIDIKEDGENTAIHSLFGPNPNVWMMFIFFYALMGFLAFVVLIIGGSRWNLGLSVGVLWFLPILCIVFALAFFSAKAGQKLANEQMWVLYNFLHGSLPDKIHRIEDFQK